MARLTLYQMSLSRLTEVLGVCSADLPRIAAAVNSAQQRLIYAIEAREEGFYGSYAEMVFNVLKADPYITLGRYGARLMGVNVCKNVVPINNQFYEYLAFGNGKQPKLGCEMTTTCKGRSIYSRGVFPTFRDLTPGHLVRIRAEDPLDTNGGKRVLVQGTDTNDTTVTSLDGTIRVQGVYVNVVSPFVDAPLAFNTLTGIQKDATNGPIQIWDVDPVTAAETLILTMEGGEVVSGYSRYYLDGLPLSCCPVVTVNGQPTVQVQALVKLNLVPVVAPSDYLLIQCEEAIIAECQSMRYSTMDLPSSKAMAAAAHKDAIKLLNGELAHYYGTRNPAVSVKPFGNAVLERQRIGTML